MPENMQFLKKDALMSREELRKIASVFINEYGVNKVRITGGEPLLRTDVAHIVSDLVEMKVKVGLTTNALKLHEHVDALVDAGLRSVNISLDSLQVERFKLMARRDGLEVVINNIKTALEAGLRVKVNMVVMRGINDDEILPFVEMTRENALHVRFIEFMPFAGNSWSKGEVYGYREMLDTIRGSYAIRKLNDEPNSTAKAWMVDGFVGTFAVISTITEPFCSTCDRLRLTAEGKMRNCLFAQAETDLLTPLRNGEDIRPLIEQNVLLKKERLGGLPEFDREKEVGEKISERPMVSIGG